MKQVYVFKLFNKVVVVVFFKQAQDLSLAYGAFSLPFRIAAVS